MRLSIEPRSIYPGRERGGGGNDVSRKFSAKRQLRKSVRRVTRKRGALIVGRGEGKRGVPVNRRNWFATVGLGKETQALRGLGLLFFWNSEVRNQMQTPLGGGGS